MDDHILPFSVVKVVSHEFCVYCGAGIGPHRREGEGTCPRCHHKDKEWGVRVNFPGSEVSNLPVTPARAD